MPNPRHPETLRADGGTPVDFNADRRTLALLEHISQSHAELTGHRTDSSLTIRRALAVYSAIVDAALTDSAPEPITFEEADLRQLIPAQDIPWSIPERLPVAHPKNRAKKGWVLPAFTDLVEYHALKTRRAAAYRMDPLPLRPAAETAQGSQEVTDGPT